jgi:predicted NACHT family NTPase
MGRGWVETGSIVVLLDGLDELQAAYRGACVAALNRYRQEYGLSGMVVCSRSSEYEALAARLQLQGALLLQPLTWPQIEAYLAQAGDAFQALREALQADCVLRELLATPLLLRVASLAYQEQPMQRWSARAVVEGRPTALFAAYVERMLQARGRASRYPRQQTLRGLAWLARH